MMLAKLGLRADEVATLTLDDIDWRAGEMLVSAKGRRRARLPLPPDVGAAVVAYLRNGRPKSSCRRLFVRTLAPHVGFASGCAITMIAKTALDRVGIEGCAHRGAHIFRHYVASRTMSRTVTGLCNFGRKLRIAALRDPPMTRHSFVNASFVNATSCPESSAADLPGDNDSARRWAMRFWRGPVPSSQVLLPNRSVWSLPIYDRATGR